MALAESEAWLMSGVTVERAVRQAGKNPRIMHVLLSLGVGGAETLVYDMVRYPGGADTRAVLCCLQAEGELGERLRGEGFSVYCRSRRDGVDLSLVGWLRDIMRDERIDVVHAHQYTPLFYAVPAALLAGGVRVVYTEHGRLFPEVKRWKRFLFNPLLALGVERIVSISDSTKTAMACYDNLPSRRIEVVHNGVDFSRMNPSLDLAAKRRSLGVSESCRILGTAARLEEIKNLPMMLEVFKLVLREVPDCCLLVAGQGSQMERLVELAGELGIGDRVKFLGLRFDLPELFQLFEVFLLTSFTEGISITLLEAMSSSVPAVVTDVGGNGEVVREAETGYLVPLGDAAAMADRVVRLLDDRAAASACGAKARERVLGQFSFAAMMEAYRAMYANSGGRFPGVPGQSQQG
jgi:L-malate glycosyltransferase